MLIGPGITFEQGITLANEIPGPPPPPPTPPAGSIYVGTSSSNILTTGLTAPGSDACTYEFWFNFSTLGSASLNTWTNGVTRTNSGPLLFLSASTCDQFYAASVFQNSISPSGVVLNTWTHIALTFPSGTGYGKIWINGIDKTNAASGVRTAFTVTELALGGRGYLSCVGYISNFRYVKGVEVYTGTFTPPTSPLTATQSAGTNISAITAGQTQLLLNTSNNSDYLADSSGYARTMTPTGTISSSSLNPFS